MTSFTPAQQAALMYVAGKTRGQQEQNGAPTGYCLVGSRDAPRGTVRVLRDLGVVEIQTTQGHTSRGAHREMYAKITDRGWRAVERIEGEHAVESAAVLDSYFSSVLGESVVTAANVWAKSGERERIYMLGLGGSTKHSLSEQPWLRLPEDLRSAIEKGFADTHFRFPTGSQFPPTRSEPEGQQERTSDRDRFYTKTPGVLDWACMRCGKGEPQAKPAYGNLHCTKCADRLRKEEEVTEFQYGRVQALRPGGRAQTVAREKVGKVCRQLGGTFHDMRMQPGAPALAVFDTCERALEFITKIKGLGMDSLAPEKRKDGKWKVYLSATKGALTSSDDSWKDRIEQAINEITSTIAAPNPMGGKPMAPGMVPHTRATNNQMSPRAKRKPREVEMHESLEAAIKKFPSNSYLGRFFREKKIKDTIYRIKDRTGEVHMIPTGVVIEHIALTKGAERSQIESILRRIDFMNGDVDHFLHHLATAIANQGQMECLWAPTSSMRPSQTEHYAVIYSGHFNQEANAYDFQDENCAAGFADKIGGSVEKIVDERRYGTWPTTFRVAIPGEGVQESEETTGRSAWDQLDPKYQSEHVGWTTDGEFACPYCGTSIGKNLKGERPFALARRHLSKHGKVERQTEARLSAAELGQGDYLAWWDRIAQRERVGHVLALNLHGVEHSVQVGAGDSKWVVDLRYDKVRRATRSAYQATLRGHRESLDTLISQVAKGRPVASAMKEAIGGQRPFVKSV
jgi:DNA-directed RNA polymerase subunit RPC12/RpoP